MKALFLPTPDLNAAKMANLFAPWCHIPIQSFQDMQVTTELSRIEILIDNLQRDIFFDAQKNWFQIISEGLNNVGEKRPKEWSESTFLAIAERKKWLVSDSRLCLTAPFWQKNLKPDTLIIAYSDPLTCAVSLSKTWRFPISVGLSLWEYYLLSAIRHCKNQPTIILSLTKFHQDRRKFNIRLTEQLGKLGYTEEETHTKMELASTPKLSDVDISNIEPNGFLTANQTGIFNELEELNLGEIANRSLSSQSQDLLTYYGDLRAGYENIKTQRNNIQKELNSIRVGQTSSQTEDAHVNTTTEEPQDSTLANDNNVEVSVQVQDMDQLEFICSKNAAILNTLQEVLQNPTKYTDKLLFLNYGQNGEQTLYFPGSSLLSLNITAI